MVKATSKLAEFIFSFSSTFDLRFVTDMVFFLDILILHRLLMSLMVTFRFILSYCLHEFCEFRFHLELF